MYLHILAAIFPIPYAVHPFALMISPAAPRVCAAISALKSSVKLSSRTSSRGEVPIVALDHAIYTSKLAYIQVPKFLLSDFFRILYHFFLCFERGMEVKRNLRIDYPHVPPIHTHQYYSVLPLSSQLIRLVTSRYPNSFPFPGLDLQVIH